MRKRIISVLLIATLVLAFGCGKKDVTSAGTETPANTSVSTETSASVSAGETSVSTETSTETVPETITEDYSEVLNMFYEVLRDFDFVIGVFEEGKFGISEYVLYNAQETTATKAVGYARMDLNDDGIKELLIVGDGDSDGAGKEILYIYTYVDGKPVLVKEGLTRDKLYLLEDNVIFEFGSMGAMSSILGEYTLVPGSSELKVVNYYFSYGQDDGREIVYHNETGEFDIETSYVVEKGIDEFYDDIWARVDDSYDILINWFDFYEYTGKNDYSAKESANVSAEYYEPEGPFIPSFVSPDADEGGSNLTHILISTDATISNVALWSVNYDADENGKITYDYNINGYMGFETYDEPKIVEPDEEIIISVAFHGDMPEYAISYRDTNGEFKRFLIYQSGMDGSLVTEYVD